MLGGGLEHGEGAVDEHLEREPRLLGALGDPDRGLVEDQVGALGDVVHEVEVAQVALDEFACADRRARSRGCARRPRTRLSRMRTRPTPASRSWSTMVEPIVPAPPVTRTEAPCRLLMRKLPSSTSVGLFGADRFAAGGRLAETASSTDSTRRPAAPSVRGGALLADRGGELGHHRRERLLLRQRGHGDVAESIGDRGGRGAGRRRWCPGWRGRCRGRGSRPAAAGFRSSQTRVRWLPPITIWRILVGDIQLTLTCAVPPLASGMVR